MNDMNDMIHELFLFCFFYLCEMTITWIIHHIGLGHWNAHRCQCWITISETDCHYSQLFVSFAFLHWVCLGYCKMWVNPRLEDSDFQTTNGERKCVYNWMRLMAMQFNAHLYWYNMQNEFQKSISINLPRACTTNLTKKKNPNKFLYSSRHFIYVAFL